MQNGRMLLAATTLFFRAHTRVLATLTVAIAIAFFCLTGGVHGAPAATLVQLADKPAVKTALPLESSRAELPRTFLRLFFLLPHLLPHDN